MNQDYITLMETEPELFRNSKETGEVHILTDPDEIRAVEEKLHREAGIVYEDEYIRLVRDAVIFPDRSRGTYIRILPRRPESAVAVLPVLNGKILLLRHFRHSLRKWMWEIPRGFGEYGITAAQNAEKELREETGITGAELEYLGKICPDSGMSADQVSVYLARFSSEDRLEKQDEKEAVKEYRMVSRKEVREMIEAGDLADGFTLSAIALACLRGKMEETK